MTIDVSVVIPVYNPGHYLTPCIDGLLEQSISRDSVEVIFIGDGSTDETPARLDQLAADHDWVTVVHQPNSGWPGQPRNHGIDLAQGEFVFFCDHDDRLGPEALERMVTRARQTGADVLVPKGVSLGRPVARGLFRANIDHAVLGVDPLSKTTTPHKLFRREFLNHHWLRYPEGKRRLEDGVFVMAAYLKADVITVLADYPCYYRYARDDGKNTALQPWTADYYFPFVEDVIDVIEANTEPGELRDSLLTRPYDAKMLGKLIGRRMSRWSPEHRQEIFDAVRRIILERFPADFHERNLPIIKRAHARALIAGRLDRMMVVADAAAGVTSKAIIHRLVWNDDRWLAGIEAELTHADGTPIRVYPTATGWVFEQRLIPADLAGDPHPLTAITSGKIDVSVTHHRDKVEWYTPAESHAELIPVIGATDDAHSVVYRCTAQLDPASLAGGSGLSPGRWDVSVRVAAWGLEGSSGLARAPRAKAAVTRNPGLFADSRLKATPQLKKSKRHPAQPMLRLTVATVARIPARLVLRRLRQLDVTASGTLTANVALTMTPAAATEELELLLLDTDDVQLASRPGRLAMAGSQARLSSELADAGRGLPAGRIRVAMKTGKRARLLAVVTVDAAGSVTGFESKPPKPIRPRVAGNHGNRNRTQHRTQTRTQPSMRRRITTRIRTSPRFFAA